MRRQVVRLSVHQTSKVLAALYFVMGVVLAPLFYLVARSSPDARTPGVGFVLLMPLLYALFGYVFVALGCALYNVVARYTGGVGVDVAPAPDA